MFCQSAIRSERPISIAHTICPFIFPIADDQRLRGAIALHIFAAIYLFTLLSVVCNDYFLPSVEFICEDLNMPKVSFRNVNVERCDIRAAHPSVIQAMSSELLLNVSKMRNCQYPIEIHEVIP